jgi:hypothetical protein
MDIPASRVETAASPAPKPSAANGLIIVVWFPSHEIVERLPGFVCNEFGHGRVIDEAEDQCYFRNEVDRSRREMDRVPRF